MLGEIISPSGPIMPAIARSPNGSHCWSAPIWAQLIAIKPGTPQILIRYGTTWLPVVTWFQPLGLCDLSCGLAMTLRHLFAQLSRASHASFFSWILHVLDPFCCGFNDQCQTNLWNCRWFDFCLKFGLRSYGSHESHRLICYIRWAFTNAMSCPVLGSPMEIRD